MPQNSKTIDDVLEYISATLDVIERVCFEEEINHQMIDDWKSTNIKLQIYVERIKEIIQHSVYDALVKRIEDIIAKLKHLVVPSGEAADTHSNIRRLPNNGKKGNSYCMIGKELLLHLISLGFLIRRIASELQLQNYTIIQYSDLWKETTFQRREVRIQKLTMML